MDVEYELSAKRVELNVLRAELDDADLWESDDYQRLLQRIAALEAKLERRDARAVRRGVTSRP